MHSFPVFPEEAAFLGLLPFNLANGNTALLGSDCQTFTQPESIYIDMTLQTHWVVNCSRMLCFVQMMLWDAVG